MQGRRIVAWSEDKRARSMADDFRATLTHETASDRDRHLATYHVFLSVRHEPEKQFYRSIGNVERWSFIFCSLVQSIW